MADDTVIMFTSDNGGLTYVPGRTSNHPYRGGKGSPYEGGVRVPAIVVWPKVVIPGEVSDEPIITMDWFATALAIASGEREQSYRPPVDGISLLPVLKKSAANVERRSLYWHYPHYHAGGATPYSAVREDRWRLVEFFEPHRTELYDLLRDPGEMTDLSSVFPRKTQALLQRLERWRGDTNAQLPRANPDYKGGKRRSIQ